MLPFYARLRSPKQGTAEIALHKLEEGGKFLRNGGVRLFFEPPQVAAGEAYKTRGLRGEIPVEEDAPTCTTRWPRDQSLLG
jgi:hypothetical protein